jgi:hypothetical protein
MTKHKTLSTKLLLHTKAAAALHLVALASALNISFPQVLDSAPHPAMAALCQALVVVRLSASIVLSIETNSTSTQQPDLLSLLVPVDHPSLLQA